MPDIICSPLFTTRSTGTERFFAGKVDEVRVFNRALNPAEIAAVAAEQGHAPVMADTLAVVDTSLPLTAGQIVKQLASTDLDGGSAHS